MVVQVPREKQWELENPILQDVEVSEQDTTVPTQDQKQKQGTGVAENGKSSTIY